MRFAFMLGMLNLNQAIRPAEEAVGYAYTEVQSSTEQDVQIRCGADDNLLVWVNGEKTLENGQPTGALSGRTLRG